VTQASLVVALLLAGTTPGGLSIEAYRARLVSIEARLLAQDRVAAASEARTLLAEDVQWGSGELLPVDRAVLEPISRPDKEGVVAPLHALLSALPDAPPPAMGVHVDRGALAALALRQTEAKAGVSEGTAQPEPLQFAEQLSRRLKGAKDWVLDYLRDAWQWLKRWLKKWLLEQHPNETEGASPGLVKVVLVGVGLILVVVLLAALLSMRRQGLNAPSVALAPAPDVDANPLSRTANEWVERAQALSADGLHREAIRAWYHALLVACYRSGLLHHQPGLTNWEYVRSLGTEVPWHGRFAEVTGRFDLEWYGRAQSSAEALDAFASEVGVILGVLGGAPA
jgi:hypothetical protein